MIDNSTEIRRVSGNRPAFRRMPRLQLPADVCPGIFFSSYAENSCGVPLIARTASNGAQVALKLDFCAFLRRHIVSFLHRKRRVNVSRPE